MEDLVVDLVVDFYDRVRGEKWKTCFVLIVVCVLDANLVVSFLHSKPPTTTIVYSIYLITPPLPINSFTSKPPPPPPPPPPPLLSPPTSLLRYANPPQRNQSR